MKKNISYSLEKRVCPLMGEPMDVIIVKTRQPRETDGKVELSTSPPRCQNEECLLYGTSRCLIK